MNDQSKESKPYQDVDVVGWPTPDPEYSDWGKDRYAAQLEVRKKRAEQEIAQAQSDIDAENGTLQEFYKAILEVGKGSIDRARASADTVQKAAAAIGTIYAAALTVAFSASDRPLPIRGIIPGILLGLALVLSTFFLAYLPDPDEGRSDPSELEVSELPDAFVAWTKKAALARRKWLRASVLALGLSLVFLPAPFVALGHSPDKARSPDWPPLASSAQDANLELQKIVYTAQIDETKTLRAKPVASDSKDYWWWIGLGAALLVIITVPQIERSTRRTS